jgi:hypothetical protein
MTRVRAYTVAEVGRALGMTSAEVHKAIERSLHANDLAAAFIKRQEAAGNPQAPAVPVEMFDPETGWLLDDSRPTRQPAPVTEMRRWYGWAPRRR